MTTKVTTPGTAGTVRWSAGGVPVAVASGMTADDVLAALDSTPGGLSPAEAAHRLTSVGPNAVRSHQVHAWSVLGRQLRSALLVLLVVTAAISFFLGDRTDAVIIAAILAASVGSGFVNE